MKSIAVLGLSALLCHCFTLAVGAAVLAGLRIIDGQPTNTGEFPFIAQIKYNGQFRCAGYVYNSQTVVTSAVCVYGLSANGFQVVVGQWDVYVPDPGEQTLYVSSIKIHEYFSSSDYKNDIALIRVSTAIAFGPTVDSIALGTTVESANGTLIGWGSYSEGGGYPSVLLKKELDLHHSNCFAYGNLFDPNTMICAGQGSDACLGDSGAPLIQMIQTETTLPSTWSTSTPTTVSQTSKTPTTTAATTTVATTVTTSATITTTSAATNTPTDITCSTQTSSTTEVPPFALSNNCETSPSSSQTGSTATSGGVTTGEPLPKVSEKWVVVGIVSHNRKCNDLAYPTVFTKMQVYSSWLTYNAGPQF